MHEYFILTFRNTLEAIQCENFLKEKDISLVIMPTPTSITKSCGISVKVHSEYIKKIEQFKDEGKIKIKNIYICKESKYNLVV
ncbi:hypothetical protein BD780_003835 [Clostridium tetanomorphum]|uniref:DUF3343 domain-containing protein n=1 Tax=Clostridium tetanomorphum TaxID=1553 RepID=A0A923EBV8_CLOTT|nr:DUF3343 domain-containing protein [Clostridium tetanomorphum]KAJ50031.1 hypothetical protein CTM_20089 [Clostridium tetanomorphum DSM 665]MBC2398992.1 DUF3343 domain-containing protein [Clostridium tetanomorphum]MBP1866198.1 hypothetical protein [Clostridium tetanomorphum]NRS86610.1 hypothetical protein [Clostridium tetanomorphum]NRZ95385.1 hypothetical protein [Clostridium tetanomorphum]